MYVFKSNGQIQRPKKAFDLVVQEETDIPQSPVARSIGFGGISRQQLLTCSFRDENYGMFCVARFSVAGPRGSPGIPASRTVPPGQDRNLRAGWLRQHNKR
jgi:hypothetical protein